jgi:undecaprenyl-diphosphatase
MIAFIEPIKQLDQSLFFFFNGMHSPFWDVVMTLFTQTIIWGIFYLTLLYFIIRKYRMKAVVIIVMLALAILISDQFSVLIKETVKRLRPTHDPDIQHLVHNVYRKGGLYAYFSSHATNTFAVAMFTAKLFKNSRYQVFIFFWAALVGYTRIYLGVHFPFDVLTGAVVGVLIGHFIYKLLLVIENNFLMLKMPKLEETGLSNQESGIILLVLLLFISTVLLVTDQLMHTNFL